MTNYSIGILGCGAISNRHTAAIAANQNNFQLLGVYDPIKQKALDLVGKNSYKIYNTEEELYADQQINCVGILTPNNLHFIQAQKAIKAAKHVILEKPATFNTKEIEILIMLAKQYQVSVFGVLQVRINPSVQIAQQVVATGILGEIRGVNLTQRWQRPLNYFDNWRGDYQQGGGILREFAIHYLDVLQFLVGMPHKITACNLYHTKFAKIADSIYALMDFGNFGGSIEISLGAEPSNIECTLLIMGSNGMIRLGGSSLNQIIEAKFLSISATLNYNNIVQQLEHHKINNNLVGGSCPLHPDLYKMFITHPQNFFINESYNVISLIEQIYAAV